LRKQKTNLAEKVEKGEEKSDEDLPTLSLEFLKKMTG